MTVNEPRILFLGLDAMDPDLILQWANAGILPTFRSLFERATFGPTKNPPGLYVGAVWPSLFTGVSPAQHGRYCYEQIVTGTYDIQRFRTSNLKRSPFWNSLSDAGRRVAVVDVPKSPLATNLNGIQLKDWGTHDPDSGSSFQTWPPTLASELTARFGLDPVGDCNKIDRTPTGFEAFCHNLTSRIRTKTALCYQLLEQENWDLFLAVFTESHCVGHQCWAFLDQTHPSYNPDQARVVGNPIKEVYMALDTAIAKVLLKSGLATIVLIVASHGMGPHYDGTFMLDEILERLDPQPGAWKRRAIAGGRRYGRALLRRVLHYRPPRGRPPVAHRRFFSIPNNDACGGIRVNLIGREPHGRVHPGKEYDALFREVRQGLLELVNVNTGRPLVRDVIRISELYQGECVNDLPDFFVEWNREAPISCVASPRIGTIQKQFGGVRTGDHKPDGFFWAIGPGIQRGRKIDGVSAMDLAPTVATLLDATLDDIDGKPIAAVLPGLIASKG